MINEDREEDAMVSYITRSGKSTVSDLIKNTPTYDVKFSALPVREIDLDFDTVAVGSMMRSIFASLDIMSAQDRINNNCDKGRTFKERIQYDKRVTVGVIFCNGY